MLWKLKEKVRVMAIVLTLGREVMRVICAYGPQSGRPDAQKVHFYDEMGSEWDLGTSSEIIVSLGDFNGHVGKYAEGFEGAHGGREKKCRRKKIAGVL